MRLYILYSILLLAVLQYSAGVDATQVKFGSLCNGNPNQIRGCDGYGCGGYGATRRGKNGVKRKHLGLDIVCQDGSTINAPFDVTLNGKSFPYSNNNAINDGVTMEGAGLCFKLFYIRPDRYSGSLQKGQKIGTLLPMQQVYPGITSHVHVQMCNESTNPTKYF